MQPYAVQSMPDGRVRYSDGSIRGKKKEDTSIPTLATDTTSGLGSTPPVLSDRQETSLGATPTLNSEKVTIVNKKTGMIKKVSRQQLPEFGLPEDYISEADTYIKLAKDQGLGLDELRQLVPETYRTAVIQGLGDVKDALKTPLTTEQANRQDSLTQAIPILSRIADSAMKAPTGLQGSLLARAGDFPGFEGGEAEFLKRQTEGFARQIAGTFAGEVGVATDQDIARWKSLLPKPGDTLEERKKALTALTEQVRQESELRGIEVPQQIIDIENQIAATGLESTMSTEPTETEKKEKTLLESAISFFFPNTVDYLKSGEVLTPDTGVSRMLQGQNPILAVMATDPIFGPAIASATGTETKQQKAFVELRNAYLLSQFFGGGGESITPKSLSPDLAKKSLDKAVASSGKNIKIPAQKFIDVIDDYVAKDPRAAKVGETMKTTLTKDMSLKQLLDRLPIWNKAYSAAGKTGKSNVAGVFDVLSRTARKEMIEASPQVAKAYKVWARSLGFKAFASKLPSSVVRQAIGTGTGIGIGALLFGGRGGQ